MPRKPKPVEEEAPEHLFFLRPEKLSDGSRIYNVHFGDHVLSAVSEAEAEQLAEKLVDAINDHTAQTADWIDER